METREEKEVSTVSRRAKVRKESECEGNSKIRV